MKNPPPEDEATGAAAGTAAVPAVLGTPGMSCAQQTLAANNSAGETTASNRRMISFFQSEPRSGYSMYSPPRVRVNIKSISEISFEIRLAARLEIPYNPRRGITQPFL